MNHNIFDLLCARSNNLKRPISCFRHLDIPLNELHIQLNIYPPDLKRPEYQICLSLTRGDLLFPSYLSENFYFDLSSKRCCIFISGHVSSITSDAQHSFRLENPALDSGGHRKYYSESEMGGFPWLKKQLDKIVDWLKSPRLVRVDPYDPSVILNEENTKTDENLEMMLGGIAGFKRALENCDLKPGIINPEQDWKERN